MLAKLVIALAAIVLPAHLWAKDEFLPPEQAYRYSTRVEGDQLIVTWKVEPGYYLYSGRSVLAT